MLTGLIIVILVFQTFHFGLTSSLLCGRTKEVQVGGGTSAGSALALALVQTRDSPALNKTVCQLRLTAPDAAAFTARLIDVKESLIDPRGILGMRAMAPFSDEAERKWSVRTTNHAQDTAGEETNTVNNNTDACKLFIYLGESNKNPTWKLSLCGGNVASAAARAGIKLLPPKIRIVWNPPTKSYHHTERLRLVITAVNSGLICNTDSQFTCGKTDLCVSSYLVCDSIRHCPGGEDEDRAACEVKRNPPMIDVLRKFAARNQEFLGLDSLDRVTESSVIMKINETDPKHYSLSELVENIKANGPMSYLICGMVICAVIITCCIAYEYCPNVCKLSAVHIYAQQENSRASRSRSPCSEAPSVSVTAASLVPDPPPYDPPPSYTSLFPAPYKASPSPVPHCSHQEPPD